MGNQACCVSNLKKDGKSEVVLNSPTARIAFARARSNQAQKDTTIQGPSIEPYSSVSVLTNQDLSVLSNKVSSEKSKGLAEKKKKELSRRKPPPLNDFETPDDYNNNANTNAINYSTNTVSQEMKPTEVSTNQPQRTHPTLRETARENLLKKGLPDYWDEDKILSVRLSDKRNLSKGSNSTRRIFSQDESYQPVTKNDLESLNPSMQGITQRVMPGKIGEEEEEIEIEIETSEQEQEQPIIDEEDFYYHEDNSDVYVEERPQGISHNQEENDEYVHIDRVTFRSQDPRHQEEELITEEKASQNYEEVPRDTHNYSVRSRESFSQNRSSVGGRSYEAPYSHRTEIREKPNLSAVVLTSEREVSQPNEERSTHKKAGSQGNTSNIYEQIIASARHSSRKSLGTPGKYAKAYTNEDLNGSRIDYNSLLKDSMMSAKKSNTNNAIKVEPSPQKTLYVADLLLSAKRSTSISNAEAQSMIYAGSARATDTLRSDCITNRSKLSPCKGKRLQTEDISPQKYQDSSASPEKKLIIGKDTGYPMESAYEAWKRSSKKIKLQRNNSGIKIQLGQSEPKIEYPIVESKSEYKAWDNAKPSEGRLSTGGSATKERPSILNGKFVVSELFESNKSGSSWREREGKLPLGNSRIGVNNLEEKKSIGDSARSRSSWGKYERSANEDEVKKLVENTLNRIYERKSVERSEISPLPLSRVKGDISIDNYATGSSLSRVGSRASFRMRDSQRWESVQKDVQKLVENATKPKSGLLETYLKYSKENREGVPKIGSRRNSRDWKGLLDKNKEYSHPSWGVNNEGNIEIGKENQHEQIDQGEVTPGFPKLLDTGENRKWENYTTQERREMLLNKKFLNVPTNNLQKNL